MKALWFLPPFWFFEIPVISISKLVLKICTPRGFPHCWSHCTVHIVHNVQYIKYTVYSTYNTQCTGRVQYPIPLSIFEGSRIPWKFKEEFNSRHPNPHDISLNIQSLGRVVVPALRRDMPGRTLLATSRKVLPRLSFMLSSASEVFKQYVCQCTVIKGTKFLYTVTKKHFKVCFLILSYERNICFNTLS
jgi:hypothetical protein